jgi:hypothetical protein
MTEENPNVDPNPDRVIPTGPIIEETEVVVYENIPEPEEKIYESWIWQTNEVGVGMWMPPIPIPAVDGVVFTWNEPDLSWYYKDEETQSWVKYVPEVEV